MNEDIIHASLFTGVGGFDLAAEWMGWTNAFNCEIDSFCRRILNYYWPNTESYEDIKQADFTIWRGKINVLSGGFPCQPYSQAGKRLGKEDDRHLWPEMLRAIREIKPNYVVGENVLGITNWNGGLVFEEVQADLEAEGYEVQAYILPAVSVNAPHRRDRVWFIAYSNGTEQKNNKGENSKKKGEIRGKKEGDVFGELSGTRDATNSKSKSSRRELQQRQKQGEFGGCNSKDNVTNTSSSRWIQNNEQFKAREFKYAGSSWERFPTQSPVCNGDDGLSSRLDAITFPKWRSESIKGGGNAVVPQVPYQIFKTIEQIDADFNHIHNS